ncbi:MAG: sporulation membrane protein YtaF, partial [Oscillospiraceae bacterium]|nr:sporulation membrane protein YtaF [Oscillospiraceae bacterium]
MTENILLVAAVSVDALLASFAYGADNIKIPFLSAAVISATGTAVLMLSMLLSGVADAVIPSDAGRWLGFIILMCIGMVSLFQNALKTFLRNKSRKNLSFSISGVGFVVSVFLDETKADTDK